MFFKPNYTHTKYKNTSSSYNNNLSSNRQITKRTFLNGCSIFIQVITKFPQVKCAVCWRPNADASCGFTINIKSTQPPECLSYVYA